MAFPDSVVDKALIACGRRCCLCKKFCGTKMELHHIKQKADEGPDTFENCIPLCFNCHADAGSYNPRHPKGRKYTEAELKAHRDNWYEKIKNSNIYVLQEKGEQFFPGDIYASDVQRANQVPYKQLSSLDTIKVFLSSDTGIQRYDDARNSLFEFIESSPFLENFSVDDISYKANALTEASQDHINNSHICIFLIGEITGVSERVYNEHIHAIQTNYPMRLYFICNENDFGQVASEIASTQRLNEIRSVVENMNICFQCEFSKFAELASSIILKEITKRFKSYNVCEQRNVPNLSPILDRAR